MSVIQYPHIASVIVTTAGGTDASGYPLPPSERTILLLCRAEPNTSNAIIYLPDGSTYAFKYIVYIKAGQESIPVNSRITQIAVAGGNEILYADSGNNTDDVEIIIGDSEDGNSTVNTIDLAGKVFKLERRNIGQLLRNEFDILSGGGFSLLPVNGIAQKVKAGEVFIAHIYGSVINTDNTIITADEYVPLGSGIVKMYSKGQLNGRLWL